MADKQDTGKKNAAVPEGHVVVHDSGNDMRTHLANERTFLAWCRTSISLIVFGFVIERFDYLINTGVSKSIPPEVGGSGDLRFVSLFAFILSGTIMLVSGYRFLALRQMIKKGDISISVFPEIMVIVSMAIIIGVVIFLVVK